MSPKSAELYDAIYTSMKDYAQEAQRIHRLIQERVPAAATLLDVACGTGLHLEHLSRHYEVAGVDQDPQMLAIARTRLPQVPFHEADMTSFDLGRTFDAVTCLFSAVGFLPTAALLRQAIEAMARHTKPGGLVVIEPWITPDMWNPQAPEAVFVDHPDLKIARMSQAKRRQNVAVITFDYLLSTADGVEHFNERHELRMHSHEEYVGSMEGAGLEVKHDQEGLMGRGLYIGRRRGRKP